MFLIFFFILPFVSDILKLVKHVFTHGIINSLKSSIGLDKANTKIKSKRVERAELNVNNTKLLSDLSCKSKEQQSLFHDN